MTTNQPNGFKWKNIGRKSYMKYIPDVAQVFLVGAEGVDLWQWTLFKHTLTLNGYAFSFKEGKKAADRAMEDAFRVWEMGKKEAR